MPRIIRIGSRGSALALRQSESIARHIEKEHGIHTKITIIHTEGDRNLSQSLAEIGGKGLFIKELEQSLLRGETELAVHSFKDVPSVHDSRFRVQAFGAREDPRDAFISQKHHSLSSLPAGARIGTSSLRRRVQLLHHFPKLQILPIRGNIHTRLTKMTTQALDGIILAAAGLIRLNLSQLITEYIPTETIIPAACQGILAIEYLTENRFIEKLMADSAEKSTITAATCERLFMSKLEGNCQSPIAIHYQQHKQSITLTGMLAEGDPETLHIETLHGHSHKAIELTHRLVNRFLKATQSP